NGYNEKFFYDRGVLYHYLYGAMAGLMSVFFLARKKKKMCNSVPAAQALSLMRKGIREG
ncbi:MAG: glycosyltransferase family 2 protein, partial [Clostridiales bacterium]|nr:glycosyltransferase family 2 protein [Clostridiales bacterium]